MLFRSGGGLRCADSKSPSPSPAAAAPASEPELPAAEHGLPLSCAWSSAALAEHQRRLVPFLPGASVCSIAEPPPGLSPSHRTNICSIAEQAGADTNCAAVEPLLRGAPGLPSFLRISASSAPRDCSCAAVRRRALFVRCRLCVLLRAASGSQRRVRPSVPAASATRTPFGPALTPRRRTAPRLPPFCFLCKGSWDTSWDVCCAAWLGSLGPLI